MISLALKNLRLRKLRTALSILAVGVGIMTLMVVRGMTEGTIGEAANRMSSIEADLLVWDKSQNAMMHSQTMSAAYVGKIAEIEGVAHVVPVLKDLVHLGGVAKGLTKVALGWQYLFLDEPAKGYKHVPLRYPVVVFAH